MSSHSPPPAPNEDDFSRRPPRLHQDAKSDRTDDVDIEQGLREAERSLLLLKARYAQIQIDQQQQQELQQRQNQLEQQLKRTRSPVGRRELQRDLKQVTQQLEELEVALESQLFSWSGLKEVFWQAIRFGGLGVVLGWVLKSLAG
ncbi:MAG: hypothetical protein Kow00121_43720 [Elainellaceae cyanobacterium]